MCTCVLTWQCTGTVGRLKLNSVQSSKVGSECFAFWTNALVTVVNLIQPLVAGQMLSSWVFTIWMTTCGLYRSILRSGWPLSPQLIGSCCKVHEPILSHWCKVGTCQAKWQHSQQLQVMKLTGRTTHDACTSSCAVLAWFRSQREANILLIVRKRGQGP